MCYWILNINNITCWISLYNIRLNHEEIIKRNIQITLAMRVISFKEYNTKPTNSITSLKEYIGSNQVGNKIVWLNPNKYKITLKLVYRNHTLCYHNHIIRSLRRRRRRVARHRRIKELFYWISEYPYGSVQEAFNSIIIRTHKHENNTIRPAVVRTRVAANKSL